MPPRAVVARSAQKVGVYNSCMSGPFWGCGCSGDKQGDYICGGCEDHCECPTAPGHEGAIGRQAGSTTNNVTLTRAT
jgi:hypothetical protein